MSENPKIYTELVTNISEEIVSQLNSVLHQLSLSSNVDEQRLQAIIVSDTADVLVAKDEDRIIGMATVNVIQKLGSSKAELEDFVVDSEQRGKGVAGILWDAVIDWCKTKEVDNLEFTSRSSREAAQKFYIKMGAEVRDTNFFRYKIK